MVGPSKFPPMQRNFFKSKILDQPSAEEFPVLTNVSQLPFLKGNDVELLIDAGQDRLPGQRRYASRLNAERFGIPISKDNLARLRALALETA